MHVVVVGCGRVGSSLSVQLAEAGHSVAIIDRRSEAFERLGEGFSGRKVVGIGFDRDRLKEAGIEQADALAAVTSGDNSNVLIARVARETFGLEHVVARIYDPRRAAIYQRLGIPTVATVAWTTERILRRVVPDALGVEWVDPSAKVSLIERPVGPGWAGPRLLDIEAGSPIRIVAVSRLGVSHLPTNDTVVQDGDVLYLAVAGDALDQLDGLLAGPPKGGH